jgi:hypothetical protein
MDEIKTDDAAAPARSIERVTLGPEESEKVTALLRQIEESSKGFLQLSRSDVVNHLVREHKSEFSTRELQQIRTHHYDPVRHLNWITPRLKDALLKNDVATVQSLQSELRNIELSCMAKARDPSSKQAGGRPPPAQKSQRRRGKKTEHPDGGERLSIKELQANLPEA